MRIAFRFLLAFCFVIVPEMVFSLSKSAFQTQKVSFDREKIESLARNGKFQFISEIFWHALNDTSACGWNILVVSTVL